MPDKKTAPRRDLNIRDRVVELRRVGRGDVLPNPNNFRTHPEGQREALRGILKEVGIAGAGLAYHSERNGGRLTFIDGHLRDEEIAEQFPVLVTDLNDAEADLLLATYDPLAAMAGADKTRLDALLRDVSTGDAAVQEMLSTLAEGNGLYFGEEKQAADAGAVEELLDQAAELQKKWKVKPGNLYVIGRHHLLCGDSTSAEAVRRLLNGRKAALCHADPPYGMGKEADGVANDNLYASKLDAFQMKWWKAARPHLEDNASAYVWGNAEDLWRLWYVGGLKDSERLTLRNEIVWAKGSGQGMGGEGARMYPPESERCLFFMLGEQGFSNNTDNYWEGWEPLRSYLAGEAKKMGWGPKDVERICGVGMYGHWFSKSQWVMIPERHYASLQRAAEGQAFNRPYADVRGAYDGQLKDGEHLSLRHEFYASRAYFDNAHDVMTDVWDFPRVEGEERHGHPTPKPVAMIARALKSSAPKDSITYEPFCGAGSTMAAGEQTERAVYTNEISPEWCAVTLERMSLLGLTPELVNG